MKESRDREHPTLCSPFLSGESDRVPREDCGPVRRGTLVDHRGGGSGWHPDVGTAGVPALEGRSTTCTRLEEEKKYL